MTTKTTPKDPIDAVRSELKKAAHKLMEFNIHLNSLNAFDAELERALGDQPAYIRNGLVWDTVVCSRTYFVIRFASWAKRAYKHPTGLFSVLRHSSKKLFVKRPKPPYVSEKPDKTAEEYAAEMQAHEDYDQAMPRYHKFAELFPDAADRNDGTLSCAEVDVLKDKFHAITKPVIDDRSTNRAHPFREDGDKHQVPELNLYELAAALEQCKLLVSGLYLIALDEQIGDFPDTLLGNSLQQTAQQLVDLILFDQDPGDVLYGATLRMFNASNKAQPQRREEAYRRLHEHFDATRTEDPWKPTPHRWFNDPHELHKLSKFDE